MLASIKVFTVFVFVVYQIIYSRYASDHSVLWGSWYYILLFGSFGTVLINLKVNEVLQVFVKYFICFFYLQVLRYFYTIGLHYEAWYHSNYQFGWWELKIAIPLAITAYWVIIEKWKR